MASDIEIAQAATPKPITEIAEALNIPDEALEPYGRIKGKVNTYEGTHDIHALILGRAITGIPAFVPGQYYESKK